MSKSPTPRIRVGLTVRPERSDSVSGHYFHVYAAPVTINDPDAYRSGAERGDLIRNPSDRAVNGLHLNDLRIGCQGSGEQRRQEDGRPHIYGWEVEYHHPWSVDRERAEQMAKTLAVIERKLRALRERFGAPHTFGQFVTRVANAIGADTILRDRSQRGTSWYSEADFQQLSIGDGAEWIDRLCEEWAAEADPKKDASVAS